MAFECLNVTKVFQGRHGLTAVLEDVTFRLEKQEFVAIVGPSGCGKTTLLKLIAGLIEPTSGEIRVEAGPNGSALRRVLVFQDHALFPWMTIQDNVAFGLRARGLEKKQCIERANELISRFGLKDFSQCYPHHLSMGMQQRAGIARAFLAEPGILLMDEPFASLDAQTKLVLQDDLLAIWREKQRTVVYVTHDIDEAIRLSDRVLVLTGRPARLREDVSIPLARPRHPADCDKSEISELKWHIWRMLEHEVRESLLALR